VTEAKKGEDLDAVDGMAFAAHEVGMPQFVQQDERDEGNPRKGPNTERSRSMKYSGARMQLT